MKTILAPTDFSSISLNAVNYAAEMANAVNTDLLLIHVCSMPMIFSEMPANAHGIAELVENAEEQMLQLKEKIESKAGAKMKVTTKVMQGEVVPEIISYCSLINPYAVVMGTESTGALERILLGGKTISAMRQLLWPLIVVPPEAKFASIQKICLACDFRNVMETIPVREIKSLVNEFHAEFHILHVSTESGDSAKAAKESRWLQILLGDLNPKYHFITGTDIGKSICKFSKKSKFDLLIVIPQKHSLINKVFRRSHSKRLVLQTDMPVVAIHE